MVRKQIKVGDNKFDIEIETGNAAFCDGNRATECNRIIRTVRKRIEDGQNEGKCMDINGNTVGKYAPIS